MRHQAMPSLRFSVRQSYFSYRSSSSKKRLQLAFPECHTEAWMRGPAGGVAGHQGPEMQP